MALAGQLEIGNQSDTVFQSLSSSWQPVAEASHTFSYLFSDQEKVLLLISYLWDVVCFADQEVCAFFVNCPPLSSISKRSQLGSGGKATLPVSQRCHGLLGRTVTQSTLLSTR